MKSYEENFKLWVNNVSSEEKQELNSISSDDKEIRERFSLPLEFGTAGMRGVLGLGTQRMNIYTVRRASIGLAKFILSCGEDAVKRGVVISYDTRRMSFEFALETAKTLASFKINARIFEDVRPVPICSFAVRHYNAAAGVMITASHNPKQYNGYKVYGPDGAQMSPEDTAEVVKFIDKSDYFEKCSAELSLYKKEDFSGKDKYKINDFIEIIGKSLDEKYFAEIEKLSLSPKEVKKDGADLKLVYTPIHGSGYKPVTEILKRLKINFNIVEEQKNPDSDFSTVPVPNPEQPEALKMGINLAEKIGGEVVIGTDPDCDRMGIALKNDKEFLLLTGNQIGVLLLNYIIERKKEEGKLKPNDAVVKSIVTTRLTEKIAESAGINTFTVLTGFKFIGEKIKEWEENGKYNFLFGFEESYGYLAGTHARDKDAVVASMLFSEMVCYYKSHGQSVYNKLIELYEKYGYYRESSNSIFYDGLDGMEKMKKIMDKLRKNPPEQIAGLKVLSVVDYLNSEKICSDGKKEIISLPKTNALEYNLENNSWVTVRPSGTEPKIKIYTAAVAKSFKDAKEINEALKEETLKKC